MLKRSIVAFATQGSYKRWLICIRPLIIMAQDRINLPSSGAGITRYFEDFKSKISVKPQIVIVIIAVVIILEIILHMYGNAFFGLA